MPEVNFYTNCPSDTRVEVIDVPILLPLNEK
jgi:hypothetical protein